MSAATISGASRPQALPAALRQAAVPVAGQRTELIQFTGPIQPDWYAALQQTGVRILHYVPDHGYLVYGEAAARARGSGATVRHSPFAMSKA